jgi:single-strand DNA-binding protein
LSLAYICGRKKEGEQYPPSQWIDATLWGVQAEALAQYLTKGTVHCFALADVRIETYTDKDNYEAYKLVARVDSVELGPRQGGGDSSGERSTGSQGAQRRPASGGAQPAQRQQQSGGLDNPDDDIPF